jgi:hypothetical protein
MWWPWPGAPEVAGKEDIRDRAAWARILGTGPGDRTSSSDVTPVVCVVRGLSEPTSSSM